MGYDTKLNEYIEGGVGGPASKSGQFSEVVGFIMDANSGLILVKRACRTWYYTGNFRFWCARPLIADASLCPAITRTPSSIRAITTSGVQPCRKATSYGA